jgi:glycosyltransferase involved in cell wall biosynthesis
LAIVDSIDGGFKQPRLKLFMTGLLPVDLIVKGGVVAANLNLFSAFSNRNDIEVIHISFNRDIRQSVVKDFAHNVKIHFLPFKSRFDLVDYVINRRALRDILLDFKPDIIHIQEITPHLMRFLHLPKQNIVVTQHGIISAEFKTAMGLMNKAKAWFKGLVERWIFPRFDNVIFISQYNRNLFPKKDVFGANIFNPVSLQFFEESTSKAPLNSLVYVGVISNNKNLKLLLRALHALTHEGIFFRLHVVGDYREKQYKKEIGDLMAETGLREQVTFLGWQNQAKILEIYQNCSVFVLPSQQETLPVSIAEAMAQGKVVLASNVGAISEMFTDGKSGLLFESNNLEQLCVRLRELNENLALIESISNQARVEAKAKYHPNLVANQTMDFYRQVLIRTNKTK